MNIVYTVEAVRAARRDYACLGLVPTMGFLHAGHMSLVAKAKAECGAVAVSIFVNPTQFAPSEDLDRYPRDVPRDLALLEEAGVDLVFLPEAREIYPDGFQTSIDVGNLARVLEGAARPHHFAGVATVVSKLFNIFQPDRAYFGQKDGQQCAVIRHIVRDLNIPVDIRIGPTIREADGLAMSSRNVYLTPAQREAAPALYRALLQAKHLFEGGERSAALLREGMQTVISAEPDIEIDYVSIAAADTLAELNIVDGPAIAFIAARLGKTRLIDNLHLTPDAGEVLS